MSTDENQSLRRREAIRAAANLDRPSPAAEVPEPARLQALPPRGHLAAANPAEPEQRVATARVNRPATVLPFKLAVAALAPTQLDYYVSYAWGDPSEAGREREAKVDLLCERAVQEGIVILRDKAVMVTGDRISDFMRQLGRGDRVFIFLSDKYLKSPHCMFELSEVWRNCRQDEAEFLEHVRVFTLPCAAIWKLSDRLDYADYWHDEHQKVEAHIRNRGSAALGPRGTLQHQNTLRFANEIVEQLTIIADVLHPQSFDAFVTYGFSDKR